MVAALCLASGAAALLPASASAAPEPNGKRVGDHGYTAQIRRTEYGIPHVLAHDYGGLGYGYGYAFAQDNLCQLADQVMTLRGERSRHLGPTETTADGTPNLASDTYHQGLRQAGTVRRLLDRPAPLGPTPELRRMVEGYAAGYNRYLRDTGTAHLPDPTCKDKPWVGPINATDIWNLVYDVNGASGATALKQAIATATPPTGAGDKVAAKPPRAAEEARGASRRDDLGSNGWALGRDVTRGRDGMLLANPHLAWIGGDRFYQVQLTIPGVIDVAGASIYGTPVVEIGHTRTLAWTHTTSYTDHASLYRLALAPGDPTSYLVDGKAVPMTRRTVPVTVRGADGTVSTVSSTLYTSRYGPVLAEGWTRTEAYALRDANVDNLRSMNEWLAIGRVGSVAQLKQAHQTYQGIPWTYTIATDTTGTAYFSDSSAVPHVADDRLERCALAGGGGGEDLPGVLDGSTAACDWGSDPDAVVPGIFGPGHQPRLTRTDYVANSNNDSTLTNRAEPLAGYPRMYRAGVPLGPRAQLGLQMIAGRRDGSDGLGAPGFTLPTLQASMLGDRNYTAELGRDDAVAMCRAHPVLTATDGTEVDVRAACDVLAAWDTRDDLGSRGAVLWKAFRTRVGGPHAWWRVPYDPAQPLTTPRGLNGDEPQVRRALADAVRKLAADKVPLDAPMGSVQRWAGIPLPGCSGGEGCFNVVNASPTSGSGGATRPSSPDDYASGSSFIMATELTAQGPRTRTILTYGQSANPESPHYTDQTVLFSHKRWVTERFTEAEIASDPRLRTISLRG
ncbi:penicillin acylase family protein [Streptomyces melanogenes]|uniref:penicillin acylase family protein n=1 Tax=Streptomyces melanogenes TaxID=67326 RepID=UPI0019C8BE2D|nr:penicillin acylase family protein [Streptomyces melanogenes]GGP32465.1 penicillin amidase [Streptomyces melanogenes]